MAIRTDLQHLAPKTFKFDGIYRGVIENNVDPEMLGRCKIRVWGLHDELKEEDQLEGIPTENLPWGEPCLGLVEGSVSGLGLFSVPLQGSHVFCFFEGGNWESLRYFATAPGQPVDAPDTKTGFNDPDGEYPTEDRLGEPDYPRLSRGVVEDTIVVSKNNNRDLTVEKSDGVTWDEPVSAYAAEYPKNIVLTTHGGITVEIDSTEGAERVHVYHPSNTYIEIDTTGNLVFRNEGDRFEITRGTKNNHVLGDDNETIDGNKTSYVKLDEENKVDGDLTETVELNELRNVNGNMTENVAGTLAEDTQVNHTEHVGSNWTVTVDGNINISAGGNLDLTAGGNVTIQGTRIDLNP